MGTHRMGNAESGHGAGNARKVEGDNSVGYVSKDSHMTRSDWNNASSFDDCFNTYVHHETRHHNIQGDHNIGNHNNLTVGNMNGNIVFGHGNVVGNEQQSSNTTEPIAPASACAELRVNVARVSNTHSLEEYTDLVLELDRGALGAMPFAEGSIDVVLFSEDNTQVTVTEVKHFSTKVNLHLHCAVPVPQCQRLYGELLSYDSVSLFKGTLLPAAGAIPVIREAPATEFRIHPKWGYNMLRVKRKAGHCRKRAAEQADEHVVAVIPKELFSMTIWINEADSTADCWKLHACMADVFYCEGVKILQDFDPCVEGFVGKEYSQGGAPSRATLQRC